MNEDDLHRHKMRHSVTVATNHSRVNGLCLQQRLLQSTLRLSNVCVCIYIRRFDHYHTNLES